MGNAPTDTTEATTSEPGKPGGAGESTDVAITLPPRAMSADDDDFEEVVRTVLRPLIEVDQGVINWVGVRDGVAEIELGGGCAGCPGQQFTVRAVVLPALRAIDPAITQVKVKLAL